MEEVQIKVEPIEDLETIYIKQEIEFKEETNECDIALGTNQDDINNPNTSDDEKYSIQINNKDKAQQIKCKRKHSDAITNDETKTIDDVETKDEADTIDQTTVEKPPIESTIYNIFFKDGKWKIPKLKLIEEETTEQQSLETETKQDVSEPLEEKRKGYICVECNIIFKSFFTLKTHKNGRHNGIFICDTCKKPIKNKRGYDYHTTEEHKYGTYTCQFCSLSLTCKDEYLQHLKTHSDDQNVDGDTFKCNHCDECFKHRDVLDEHCNDVHPTKPNLVCIFCNKSFKYRANFLIHMAMHGEKTGLICGVCGKQCKSKNEILEHSTRHRGQRSYTCKECDLNFASPQTLKMHNKCFH